MKLPAPLTSWDKYVWAAFVWRGIMEEWDADRLQAVSVSDDRRDASLMFEAQRARSRMFPVDLPPLSMIGCNGEVACGGAIFLPVNREHG